MATPADAAAGGVPGATGGVIGGRDSGGSGGSGGVRAPERRLWVERGAPPPSAGSSKPPPPGHTGSLPSSDALLTWQPSGGAARTVSVVPLPPSAVARLAQRRRGGRLRAAAGALRRLCTRA